MKRSLAFAAQNDRKENVLWKRSVKRWGEVLGSVVKWRHDVDETRRVLANATMMGDAMKG